MTKKKRNFILRNPRDIIYFRTFFVYVRNEDKIVKKHKINLNHSTSQNLLKNKNDWLIEKNILKKCE